MVGTRHRETSAANAGTPDASRYKGTGVWPQVVAGIVLAVAIVIFIAQNTHAIHMKFLWVHFRTSPAVLTLGTAVATLIVAVALGAALRRRRRRVLTEREELARLRSEAPGHAVDVRREEDEPPAMPS